MIQGLAITVLVENHSARPELQAEHGLALWIEADDRRLLLDTGAGSALLPNAEALGIDLASADGLILSHGHSDHTGAVGPLLTMKPSLPVYFHPDALLPRFSLRGGTPRAVGMPIDAMAALGSAGKHSSKKRQQIAPGICCTGEIPRCAGMQPSDPMLFRDAAACQPDPLLDDQALVIDTPAGLVVISGCCHAGIDPTLVQVRSQQPTRPILALVGGLHLKACDSDERRAHIAHLSQYDVQQVIAGHCTGAEGEDLIDKESESVFSPLRCGDRWQLKAGRLQLSP